MLEIITQINDLARRLGKLESLETPFKSYGLWAARPTVPFDGQRFFATDATRRLEYEWDNTATKWLSTQVFPLSIATKPPVDIAQGTTGFAAVIPREHTTNGIYLTGIEIGFTPRATQTGAIFYTLTGNYSFPANSPANGTLTFPGATDTKLLTTINTNYSMPQDYTSPITIPAAAFRIGLVMTPTGAAGAFVFEATASYRLVG